MSRTGTNWPYSSYYNWQKEKWTNRQKKIFKVITVELYFSYISQTVWRREQGQTVHRSKATVKKKNRQIRDFRQIHNETKKKMKFKVKKSIILILAWQTDVIIRREQEQNVHSSEATDRKKIGQKILDLRTIEFSSSIVIICREQWQTVHSSEATVK